VKKLPVGKVQRIRFYLNQQERLKLRKWMGTARWTYNRCLVAVEKEGVNSSFFRQKVVEDIKV
jgi:hypothetical protein